MELIFGLKIYMYFGETTQPWDEGPKDTLIIATQYNGSFKNHLAKSSKTLATYHDCVKSAHQTWKLFPEIKRLL
jgi:hypothetical protein